jgi:hypothetical protein
LFLATLVLPGALANFSPMSPVRWLVTYLAWFLLAGIPSGALFEVRGVAGAARPTNSSAETLTSSVRASVGFNMPAA